MFNPEKLEREYNKLADGKPKLAGIKMAIQEADNNKSYHWALHFREDYIQESIFEDDSFNAIIMFPEYMAIFDEHPELQERHKYSFMVRFKWIVENLKCFYQVSKEQVDKYFEEFKKRCNMYGYSLRSYYMKRTELYKYIDTNIAKQDFEQYKKSARDNISDCHACDTNKQVSFELDFGDIETALKTAKPILVGNQRCAEVPQVTYGALMTKFTKIGQFDEALHYGNLMRKMVDGDMNFLLEIGDLLTLYSIINLNDGYEVFDKNANNFINSKNPLNNLHFSIGAYRLFKAISQDDCKEIFLKNLSKKYPIYNSEGIYQTETLIEYFYNYSKDLATKFDNRNGTSYFMDLLSYEYKTSNEVIKLPSHLNLNETQLSVISIPLKEDINLLDIGGVLKKNLEQMNVKFLGLEPVADNPNNNAIGIWIEYQNDKYNIILDVNESKIPNDMSSFKHNILKKDYQTAFENVNKSVLCVAQFKNNYDISYHLQIKVLCALEISATCIYDISRNIVLSYKWAELCAYSQIPPSIDYLVNVEIISDDESDTVWLYTRGLSCCGIRELEIIGAKKEFIDNYYQMLMFAIENIIYYNRIVDEKEILSVIYNQEKQLNISVTWQLTEDILENVPEDMFGSISKRYDDIFDTACLCVYPTTKSKKSRFMWELSDDLVSNIICPYTYAKTELDTALAFERLPFIKKILETDLKCTVKVTFEMDISSLIDDDMYNNLDDEEIEDLYEDYQLVTINLESFEDDIMTGYLIHDIPSCDYNKGDIIKIDVHELYNWIISFEDGINVTPDNIYMIL